jgi:hypothetical protein
VSLFLVRRLRRESVSSNQFPGTFKNTASISGNWAFIVFCFAKLALAGKRPLSQSFPYLRLAGYHSGCFKQATMISA